MASQILFGPRRCEGIGLSDGETMERLWSYLRRFSRMTKEMRPAHRIDVLSSALLYYGLQTKEKLGKGLGYWCSSILFIVAIIGRLLLTRWERAVKLKGIAAETLHELMPGSYHGNNRDHAKL